MRCLFKRVGAQNRPQYKNVRGRFGIAKENVSAEKIGNMELFELSNEGVSNYENLGRIVSTFA